MYVSGHKLAAQTRKKSPQPFFYKKNKWEPPSKKQKGGEKQQQPEEQEGIPQHQHFPLAKHREGMNAEYHEEQ
jgi:hypothetical protein